MAMFHILKGLAANPYNAWPVRNGYTSVTLVLLMHLEKYLIISALNVVEISLLSVVMYNWNRFATLIRLGVVMMLLLLDSPQPDIILGNYFQLLTTTGLSVKVCGHIYNLYVSKVFYFMQVKPGWLM